MEKIVSSKSGTLNNKFGLDLNKNENLPAIINKRATAIVVNPDENKNQKGIAATSESPSSSTSVNGSKEDENYDSISSNRESEVYSRSDYVIKGSKRKLIVTFQQH